MMKTANKESCCGRTWVNAMRIHNIDRLFQGQHLLSIQRDFDALLPCRVLYVESFPLIVWNCSPSHEEIILQLQATRILLIYILLLALGPEVSCPSILRQPINLMILLWPWPNVGKETCANTQQLLEVIERMKQHKSVPFAVFGPICALSSLRWQIFVTGDIA